MSAAETITPLIQIREKLENCDEKQEKIFCQQLKHKLLELDIWDIDFVKRLLCYIHSNITTDFFQELLDLIPQNKDDNDYDEYTHDDTLSEHVVITELPTDLLIHSFQFLEINDLYNLEKTCRSFCIIARNPSSLYHLNIAYKSYFEKFVNYQNKRYLKIESLTLNRYTEDFTLQTDDRFDYWTSLLPIFPSLSHICIINTNVHCIGIIPSTICCSTNIKEAHFYHISLGSVFTLISKCKNIEILDFVTDYDNNDDHLIYKDTFMDVINSSCENGLPYLKHLMIDLSSATYLPGQHLIYWLLANGLKHKTLTLMDDVNIGDHLLSDITASVILNSFFNPNSCDSHIFDMQRRALLNISQLNLGALDVYSINNFAKWIKIDDNILFDQVNVDLINVYTEEFMYDSDPYSFPDDLINPLHIVLSKGKQSKIYWTSKHQIIDIYSRSITIERFTMSHNDKGIIGTMRDWPSRILKGDLSCHSVSEIQIMPIIKAKEFYAHYDIFNGAIKYWLELKCSKIVELQYDVTFIRDGMGTREWDSEVDEIEFQCEKYPIQVDITSSCSKIRVCF